MALEYLVNFFIVPLAAAAVVYALTHFQLLFFNRLLKMDMSSKLRTKINILAFIFAFAIAEALVIFNTYYAYRKSG